MMLATQRHGEFIAPWASERSGLGKFQVVGIARRPLADEAGLAGHKSAMGFVALSDRLLQRRCYGPQVGQWASLRGKGLGGSCIFGSSDRPFAKMGCLRMI